MTDLALTDSRRASAHALGSGLDVAVAALLFGDYLALTVSYLTTGAQANWILGACLLQFPVLALALLLGRLEGGRVLLSGAVLAALGIGAVFLFHVGASLAGSHRLTGYSQQKIIAWFGLCMPGLLCGLLIGQGRELPGRVLFSVFVGPLLAMCAAAVAIDPRLLTIQSYDHLAVMFGVLVLPAHQGLAYVLAKASIFCAAAAGSTGMAPRGRWVDLGLLALLVSLLLLTGARSYTAATLLALVLVWSLGRKRVLLSLPVVAVAVLCFQTYETDLIGQRLDPYRMLESVSWQERLYAWRAAWEAFADAPLFGQGPGGFASYLNGYERAYPHNVVLEVMAEFGTAGLALFLWMLASSIRGVVALLHGHATTTMQRFAVGFFVFSLGGAMFVGDLIRNHFLFLSIGLVHGARWHASRHPAG